MGTRLRACAMTVLASCLVLVGLPAMAVEQVDDFIALPFTTYGDMLVDAAHEQVFVTAGSGSNEIAVVPLDGSGVHMVEGTPGAAEMSISQDGRHVYATLRNGDGIAEIDTSTLELRRFSTGSNSCPTEVAAVAGYVWFVASGDDCNQWTTIRRLDPATGIVSGDIASGGYQPALRVVPGTTRFLSAETGISRSDLRVYDVADGTLQQVVSGSFNGYLSKDLRLTNDGEHLMIPRYGGVNFHRLSDFAADGVSTFSSGWQGASAADDETVVGAARDSGRVEVVRRGASGQLNSIDLGPTVAGNDVMELELLGDQMFAITVGSTLRLYQVDRPNVPAPTLSIEVPASSTIGSPVAVSGVLSDQGVPIPGAVITVRQEGAEQPLGSPTTDADGRFSLEFVPHEPGTLQLSASYAGEGMRKATMSRAAMTVVRRPVELTLAGPESVWPGESVSLSGALFEGSEALAGVSLDVHRLCAGSYAWESLGTVVTSSSGTFATTDTPGSCRSYDYSVAFAGDDLRAAKSAFATVKVNWVQPAVELTTPGSAHVGDTVNVTGTLTTPDGPLANTELVARVSTTAGSRSLGELTTDSTGWFETTDVPAMAGSHCYVVSYAGDSRNLAASSSRCVGVTKWPTALTLSGPSSAELDAPAVLTGRLTSNGDALAGVELALSRSDQFRGTETLTSVTTGADGAFTIRDVPPNGGAVTYAVSYAGTVSRSAVSKTWTVAVSRPQRTLEMSTDSIEYGYGATAQIALELTTDSSRTVRVYAEEFGRVRTMIFSGDVPESGLTLQRVMRRNTVFSAVIAEDGRALTASASVSRKTKADLRTQLLGSYGTSGRYKLYRPAADPRFATTLLPARDGGCLYFRVQRYSSTGGWRQVLESPCMPIANSTATWTLTGVQARKTPYRVQPILTGDLLNAPSSGGWVYLKFV